MLVGDKKIITFVGTSKNGTSFIVNNLAELLSSTGVNVAILDTTRNKNSYYIYTNNEEELRGIATHSIYDLTQGIANVINNLLILSFPKLFSFTIYLLSKPIDIIAHFKFLCKHFFTSRLKNNIFQRKKTNI